MYVGITMFFQVFFPSVIEKHKWSVSTEGRHSMEEKIMVCENDLPKIKMCTIKSCTPAYS